MQVTVYPLGQWASSVLDYSSQSSGNGFLTKIELQDTGDTWYTIWTGTDESEPGDVVDFVHNFTETTYQVKAVRLTVDTDHDAFVPVGIDAVRLLTATESSPANNTPTAENFNVHTWQGRPVFVRVMAEAADADGDALRLSIASWPEHGWVEINNAGTPGDSSDDFLIYHPHPYYSGSDSFTYTVTDVWGATATATVNITIHAINQSPLAGNDMAETTINTAVVIAVLDNDFDPEQDELEVVAVTQGQNGTVTITDNGTTVTYTPDTDFVGVDVFSYQIDDGNGGTATAQVMVQVFEAGQWASVLLGMSSNIDGGYQALGAPDGLAWVPEPMTKREFITVGFASAEYATGLLVRQPHGGTIFQVDLRDTGGTWHTIWTGFNVIKGGGDLVLNFPETTYQVNAARIFVYPGGNSGIDAVRLLTDGDATSLTLNGRTFDPWSGSYVDTTFDGDDRPIEVKTYFGGVLVQTEELTYTDDYVSAILTTDALNRQTQRTYDEDGNVLTETFGYGTAGASTTTYGYTDGLLTSLTDPKGNTTTWDYNGSQVVMTDPFGIIVTKEYDQQGRLVSIINGNGLLITYEYDQQGRLVTETWYDGPTDQDNVVDSLTWSYTVTGLLAKATNAAGSYSFGYDNYGQVIHVTQPTGVSLTMAYDTRGNRILVQDSFGGVVSSIYDEFNRLVYRKQEAPGETPLGTPGDSLRNS